MTTTVDNTAEDRLDRLEQMVRALTTRVSAMADEVVTHRLRVVDDAGRPRVTVNNGRQCLTVTGPDGVDRISMTCSEDFGTLSMHTSDNATALVLTAGEESGEAEVSVSLFVKNGEGVDLTANSGVLAPGLTLCDVTRAPAGEPTASIRGAEVEEIARELERVRDVIARMGIVALAFTGDSWVDERPAFQPPLDPDHQSRIHQRKSGV